MIKIDWDKGFVGVDGMRRSRTDIENWYVGLVEPIVRYGLTTRQSLLKIKKKKKKADHLELKIIDDLLKNDPGSGKSILYNLILARPEQLERYAKEYDDRINKHKDCVRILKKGKKKKNGQPGKDKTQHINATLLKAFCYENLRSHTIRDVNLQQEIKILPMLSYWLNIKSCPYCNEAYTLTVRLDSRKSGNAGNSIDEYAAKFQFDHFFDKSHYPVLSVSLYNLIPSCATCNLAKTDDKVPLRFHPYYMDPAVPSDGIVRFSTNTGLRLLTGAFPMDEIEIDLKNHLHLPDGEVDKFYGDLDLSARYGRHRDIVQEVYARVYMEKYYGNAANFKAMGLGSADSSVSKELYDRVMHGNYVGEADYVRRPLAKFISDIDREARGRISGRFTQ